MFYTKFCELSSNINSSPTRVVLDLGMSKGNLDRWKKGGVPSPEVLQKIAAYFDVSVDFLLGRTTIKNHRKLLNEIDNLSEKDKQLMRDWSDNLLREEKAVFESNASHIYLAGSDGTHEFFAIPKEKIEQFKKIIEATMPELIYSNEEKKS